MTGLFDLKTESLWPKDNQTQRMVGANCWNSDLVWSSLPKTKHRPLPMPKPLNVSIAQYANEENSDSWKDASQVGAPGPLPMGKPDIYLKTGLNCNRHREMSKYSTSRKRNEYNCLCSLCIMNNLQPRQSKSCNTASQNKALLNQCL